MKQTGAYFAGNFVILQRLSYPKHCEGLLDCCFCKTWIKMRLEVEGVCSCFFVTVMEKSK